jgi:hypothetical protein
MVLEAHEVAPCHQHGSVQDLNLRIFGGECCEQEDTARESEKMRLVRFEGMRRSREI